MIKTRKKRKKKKKVSGGKALVYIKSSYNNTLITVTDLDGNALVFSSPGIIGYTGSKKSTAYVATKAAEDAAKKAKDYGVNEVEIFVKGLGVGRNAAIKGIRSGGLKISVITDKTPIPHGGPTPRKMPRGS